MVGSADALVGLGNSVADDTGVQGYFRRRSRRRPLGQGFLPRPLAACSFRSHFFWNSRIRVHALWHTLDLSAPVQRGPGGLTSRGPRGLPHQLGDSIGVGPPTLPHEWVDILVGAGWVVAQVGRRSCPYSLRRCPRGVSALWWPVPVEPGR